MSGYPRSWNLWYWLKFARKYSLHSALFYWREQRKPENRPKVRVR